MHLQGPLHVQEVLIARQRFFTVIACALHNMTLTRFIYCFVRVVRSAESYMEQARMMICTSCAVQAPSSGCPSSDTRNWSTVTELSHNSLPVSVENVAVWFSVHNCWLLTHCLHRGSGIISRLFMSSVTPSSMHAAGIASTRCPYSCGSASFLVDSAGLRASTNTRARLFGTDNIWGVTRNAYTANNPVRTSQHTKCYLG